MNTIWNKIKQGVSKGYQTFAEKTEEMTQIGRLRVEIIALKRDIEKAFIELGGRFYQSIEDKTEKEILNDQKVITLLKHIKNKENKLRSIEEKIESIKNQKIIVADD
jgi:hypothetical protein